MNLNKLTYTRPFFGLLNHLTDVCEDIPITIENGRTLVRQKTKNNSIAYILSVAPEIFSFDVEGDKIAFQNFSEFNQMLGLMSEDATIGINDAVDTLVIDSDNSELQYNLGLTDAIDAGFKGVPIDAENNLVFGMNSSELKQLKKVLSTIPGKDSDKRISFKVDEGSEDVKIAVSCTSHNNKWTETKQDLVVETNGSVASIDIKITSDVFKVLPDLESDAFGMTITVCSKGFVKFRFASVESEDFQLDIYTSKAIS